MRLPIAVLTIGLSRTVTGVASYGALGHVPTWSLALYINLAISIYI